MIEIEGNLALDLDGQSCLTLRTEAGRQMISFVSPSAFRQALKAFRHTAATAGVSLPPLIRQALQSQRVVVLVGDEEVAEIIPGEPASLAARLAGLNIPGLRLRGGRLARLALGGG